MSSSCMLSALALALSVCANPQPPQLMNALDDTAYTVLSTAFQQGQLDSSQRDVVCTSSNTPSDYNNKEIHDYNRALCSGIDDGLAFTRNILIKVDILEDDSATDAINGTCQPSNVDDTSSERFVITARCRIFNKSYGITVGMLK